MYILNNKSIPYTHKCEKLSAKIKKMADFRKILVFFHRSFSALLLLLLLSSCRADPGAAKSTPVSRTGLYFDTVITISIYDRREDEAQKLLERCMALADRYDHQLFSPTDQGSELWAVNHADGEAVAVSPETSALLETAMSWSERTDHAFLPTLGALTALWNFTGSPPGPVPDSADIDRALLHTSPDAVRIRPLSDGQSAVTLDDPDLRLDLGGIAKGYIADRMRDYLRAQDVKSAVINLGGNVLLLGGKPDGSDFQVGIQDPDADTGTAILTTVAASDISIVTSGVYERFFEERGQRYHHILDPETGRPTESGLISATILSPDSTTGDALSTACLVLGPVKARALIESLPGIEALLVTEDRGMIRTTGFPG